MEDPEFLDLDDVLELHEGALDRWGGSDGIRDKAQLASLLRELAGV